MEKENKFEFIEPEDGIPVDDIDNTEEIENNDLSDENINDNENIEDNNNDIDEDIENEEELDDEQTIDNNQENQDIIELDGLPIKINSKEELVQLLERGIEASKTLEQVKPELEIFEGLKKNNVSPEELFLLANAKQGDKKALAKLLKTYNVDLDELSELIDSDEINNYKPKPVIANFKEIEVKKIINEYVSKPNGELFKNFLQKELDVESKKLLFNDPKTLKEVGELLNSELSDEIIAEYTKLKLLYGDSGPKINLFAKASQNVIEAKQKELKLLEESKNQKIVEKRKKASVGSKKPQTKTQQNSQPNIEEMSDEEFERYYQQIVYGTL